MTIRYGVAPIQFLWWFNPRRITARAVNDSGVKIIDLPPLIDPQKFNQVAGRFAVGAITDQSTAIDLLATTLNSYGDGVEVAEKRAEQFNRVIEQGRVTANELSAQLGTAAPIASQLGVSVEELGGAFSTVAINGLSASRAATAIRGLFIGLGKRVRQSCVVPCSGVQIGQLPGSVNQVEMMRTP